MERIVAIITPKEKNRWTNEYLISLTDLYRLVSYLNVFGFFDILFLGNTGEGSKLNIKEARKILEFAEEYKYIMKKKNREGKVIINITRNKKQEVLEVMKNSEWCDFFMINKKELSYKDLFYIITKAKKPVIYYLTIKDNYYDENLLRKLLKEENVVGVKDSLKDNYRERKKIIEDSGRIYYFGRDLNFLKEKKGNLISGTLQLFPELWKKERYDIIEKIVKKIEEKEKFIEFPKICKYMLSETPPFIPLVKNHDIRKEEIEMLRDLKEYYINLKKKYKF